MPQPAIRIDEKQVVLLSSIVTVSFSGSGEGAVLVLDLSNNKALTFTDGEAEAVYNRIMPLLEIV